MSVAVDMAKEELNRHQSTPSTAPTIHHLTLQVEPLAPATLIESVAELFLHDDQARLLSLPVVDNGRPIGTVSRYQLMTIFLNRYGRELYGRRAVTDIMSNTPLIVERGESIDSAAQYITRNISFPITEDFIVVENGEYVGAGLVLDVLKAIEAQVNANARELEKAYVELKASQAQLIQSEKMASLGQMVAGVAHEINTPLGYVKNNVEMSREIFSQARELLASQDTLFSQLMSEQPDDNAIQQALQATASKRAEVSHETLEDMAGLIDDSLYGIEQITELVISLKNFSRLDQAKLSQADLNECLDSALTIARNNIKYKADVVKNYGNIPKISCSPSQINQVFLNMINNAAQAMDERGTITITTSHDDTHVEVRIADNGKGIPVDNIKKIFDPFFTTKAIGEGTGLGLSISFQIIEQHHGAIAVESEEGVGTTFIIRLPIRNELVGDKLQAVS